MTQKHSRSCRKNKLKNTQKLHLKNIHLTKAAKRRNFFCLTISRDRILTSKKGKLISNEFLKSFSEGHVPTLVVFGSPERGLHEIMGGKINQVQNSKILNFFPNQATDTIRLDEAINGVLSILNLFQTH